MAHREHEDAIIKLTAEIETLVAARAQEWLKQGVDPQLVHSRLMTVGAIGAAKIVAMVAAVQMRPEIFVLQAVPYYAESFANWGVDYVQSGQAKPARLTQ